MFSNLLLITLACTGILMTNASLPAGRYLCERYPHLAICALHAEVDQAIQEMSYLVHVTEQQQPPVLIG
jgi:predicted RNase H-like nuclease